MNGTPKSPRSRSQAGGRRISRPSSHLHSDCAPEADEDSPSLGQRSASLTTLQPAIIQPRMAQLETLEAEPDLNVRALESCTICSKEEQQVKGMPCAETLAYSRCFREKMYKGYRCS
ncbi:hypothetical protein Trydic_g23413 [Trypoxylus dichotomus]